MFTLFLDEKIVLIIAAMVTPLLCAVLLRLFSGKLPRDHGREFAVDGQKSAGKVRGAGIIFVISFIICSLLFVKVSIEYVLYYILLFAGMLTGYLDDRSDKPWNEYKKGALDLLISAGTSAAFVYYNRSILSISFFGHSARIHPVIYFILGIILVWMLINAVNCTDGIDGFSGVLSSVSYISAAAAIIIADGDFDSVLLVAVMILTLMPYLWKNSEPSSMLMGDAGSRALGLFLAILIMKTGNLLLVIPLCFVICVDGLIGIAKVSMIRFLHLKVMKKIRTPLHDHFRKNIGWSNSQVIYRYVIIQSVISLVTLLGCSVS